MAETSTAQQARRIAEQWGLKIRQRRQALGMSQRELAEAIGVAQPTIVRYEAGTRQVDLETQLAIAAALTTDQETLFSW